MKNKKSSETLFIEHEGNIMGDNNPTEILEITQICSSCKKELPDTLDRGICPHCQKRTG